MSAKIFRVVFSSLGDEFWEFREYNKLEVGELKKKIVDAALTLIYLLLFINIKYKIVDWFLHTKTENVFSVHLDVNNLEG